MSKAFGRSRITTQDDHWIPLSDLMTGLMMMFLLISVIFMLKVEADSLLVKSANSRMREIALLYEQMKTQLYVDLREEFKNDLVRWDAEVLPDATVRFKAPDVLFAIGQAELRPKFKETLDEFFPRYVAILGSAKYAESIEEVRIEGHTSGSWLAARSYEEAYFQNLALSQERTRNTLHYILTLPSISSKVQWLLPRISATGLSYSRRIFDLNGQEDSARSQRVEFRVRTDAETKISKILETTR
jgi:outer membrane protein OmpA-like peptidoglycan-associated protein